MTANRMGEIELLKLLQRRIDELTAVYLLVTASLMVLFPEQVAYLPFLFCLHVLAQDVIHDYDRSVDFSQYKTFAWVGNEPIPIVSDSQLLGTDMKSSTRDSGALPANVPYGHWRPFYTASQDYRLKRKGTLPVDLVDRASSQLVWRGSATQTYSKPEEGPKRAIDKMFKKFPPK
jgi:hypothetical protein